MKLKRVLAIIIAAVMVLSLAACSEWDEMNNKETYVYWLNFKPELDGILQALAEDYNEEKGVDVKIVTPDGDYEEALLRELESDEPPTLFVIGKPTAVKTFQSYAADLKQTDIAKLLNTEDYNLKDEDNRLISIPYCVECFGIAVNPQYVEYIGYSADEITDFDTLKTVVESIHENASWLGYDAFAAVDVNGSDSWRYTAHLANIEYAYEDRAANPWEACPASLTGAYMDNFRQLYDLCVNNATAEAAELTGGHDGLQEFKDGKAAFYLAGSWEFATISEQIPDAVMIPYYCGVKGEKNAGLCVGTENCWAVNDNISEESRQATLDFMEWLMTDADASAVMVKQLGPLPYKKSAKSEDNGFLNCAKQYEERECYDLSWSFFYQPDTEAYRKELTEALAAYNADQSDDNWKAVRTAMIDGWMRHYVAVNRE